jgi:hypothetical protein
MKRVLLTAMAVVSVAACGDSDPSGPQNADVNGLWTYNATNLAGNVSGVTFAALQLSDAAQKSAFQKAANHLVQDLLNESVNDQRLSPTEEADLKGLAAHLGLEIEYSETTKELLHRFALLWRIENGDIPVLPVALNLAKGEVCHFSAPAR